MGRTKAEPCEDETTMRLRELYTLKYKRDKYLINGINTIHRANKMGYAPSKSTQSFYQLQQDADGKWFIPESRKAELKAMSLVEFNS
jgi:hypothetical protein